MLTEELSTSQKQEKTLKKYRDKRLIKNWRSISLLQTDVRLIPKVLAKRTKKFSSSLISPNQAAYLENRFISERDQLISDILEVINILKIKGFL